MRLRKFLVLFGLAAMTAHAGVSAEPLQHPDCSGTEGWPTSMAYVHLKDAGMTIPGIDFSKTKTVRLASERIGDDRYRQIHEITFVRKDGSELKVITSNIASHEECSMSGVEVFVVSKLSNG
jgi:hypothetical protein